MAVEYEVRILDWNGRVLPRGVIPLADIDGPALSLDVGLGLVGTGITGTCEVGINDLDLFNQLRKDYRIAVYRSIDGGPEVLEANAEFLIRWRRITSNGARIRGVHVNALLDSRFVLYSAGTPFTQKSGKASDVIKAFVRENLGGGVSPTNRDGDDTGVDISSLLSIAGNSGAGSNVSLSRTRRRLSRVIKEICDASAANGQPLFAEVYSSGGRLIFDVFPSQRGRDRRAGRPLSRVMGNIIDAELVIDEIDEVTFGAVGGAGEGLLRSIGTAIDRQRLERSPFGRIEAFTEDSIIVDQATLNQRAAALVREGAPKVMYTGTIVSVPGFVRGVDFDYGDYVRIEDFGRSFYARLNTLSVTVRRGVVSDALRVKVDQI
jgi:hypothetical protein